MDYNILIADFAGKNRICMTDTLYQYDYGQKLKIESIPALPQTFEAHFSNVQHGGVSITVTGMDGIVDIPNSLLMTGKRIYCWIYVTEPGSGETEYQVLIPVQARPMPEYYDVTDVGVFDSVVQQVGDYAATATAGATNATASATAAATSASEAVASASAAETAKNAAQTAQGKAEDAQAAAETAAQSAADSASAASASATSAGQSATSAGLSATAAAGSATTAGNAAQTATTKAGEAFASADAAAASETAAQTAQTAAETAATNAGQSASTATAKAAEAAQSASNAAASETAAEAAATRAETAAASLKVDDALSDSSVNPVQNRVVTESVTQVKSALDAMSTASVSDEGKALKAKTVTDGKVTEWEFGEAGGNGGETWYEAVLSEADYDSTLKMIIFDAGAGNQVKDVILMGQIVNDGTQTVNEKISFGIGNTANRINYSTVGQTNDLVASFRRVGFTVQFSVRYVDSTRRTAFPQVLLYGNSGNANFVLNPDMVQNSEGTKRASNFYHNFNDPRYVKIELPTWVPLWAYIKVLYTLA